MCFFRWLLRNIIDHSYSVIEYGIQGAGDNYLEFHIKLKVGPVKKPSKFKPKSEERWSKING